MKDWMNEWMKTNENKNISLPVYLVEGQSNCNLRLTNRVVCFFKDIIHVGVLGYFKTSHFFLPSLNCVKVVYLFSERSFKMHNGDHCLPNGSRYSVRQLILLKCGILCVPLLHKSVSPHVTLDMLKYGEWMINISYM